MLLPFGYLNDKSEKHALLKPFGLRTYENLIAITSKGVVNTQ